MTRSAFHGEMKRKARATAKRVLRKLGFNNPTLLQMEEITLEVLRTMVWTVVHDRDKKLDDITPLRSEVSNGQTSG